MARGRAHRGGVGESATRAGDRIRTGDLNLGKVALYRLSYTRVCCSLQPAACRAGGVLPEPPVGFEPTTAALRMRCSTPELRWRAVARYRLESGTTAVEPAGLEPATS